MSRNSSLYLLCNVTEQKSFCLLSCVIDSHSICKMSHHTLQICLSITCLFQKGLFGAKMPVMLSYHLIKLKFLPHFLMHFDLDMLWGENKISAMKSVQNNISAMKSVHSDMKKEHSDKNSQSIKRRLYKKSLFDQCSVCIVCVLVCARLKYKYRFIISLALSFSRALVLSHSLSHTVTQAHTLSFSLTQTHTHTHLHTHNHTLWYRVLSHISHTLRRWAQTSHEL